LNGNQIPAISAAVKEKCSH